MINSYWFRGEARCGIFVYEALPSALKPPIKAHSSSDASLGHISHDCGTTAVASRLLEGDLCRRFPSHHGEESDSILQTLVEG